MTTYTHSQIRAAILATADLFERRPELYDFHNYNQPNVESWLQPASPAVCMWSWVGSFLGVSRSMKCDGIARMLGHSVDDLYRLCRPEAIAENHAPSAASALRAFADLYYAEQLDPSYIKARIALQRFIEGDDSARVEFKEAVGVMYDAAVQRGMEERGYAR